MQVLRINKVLLNRIGKIRFLGAKGIANIEIEPLD
jgi:hypothetical protein